MGLGDDDTDGLADTGDNLVRKNLLIMYHRTNDVGAWHVLGAEKAVYAGHGQRACGIDGLHFGMSLGAEDKGAVELVVVLGNVVRVNSLTGSLKNRR